MLIVAMPRSASTSLSHTLAGITEMRRSKPTHRGLDPSYNPHLRQLATGYEKMPHAGAIRFESTQLVDWITARDRLYREHILPVREHRDIFRTIIIFLKMRKLFGSNIKDSPRTCPECFQNQTGFCMFSTTI